MSKAAISQCWTAGMQHRRKRSHYLWIRRKTLAKNRYDCLLGLKLGKIMPRRVDADPERIVRGLWECHGMLHVGTLGFGGLLSIVRVKCAPKPVGSGTNLIIMESRNLQMGRACRHV